MKRSSINKMHGKARIIREDMKVLQQMIRNRSVYAGRSALYKRRPKHRKIPLHNYRFDFSNQ